MMQNTEKKPPMSEYFFRQAMKAGKLPADDDGYPEELIRLYFTKFYENLARECNAEHE